MSYEFYLCSPTAETFFKPFVQRSVDEVTRQVERHQTSVCVPQTSAPLSELFD